MVFGFAMATGSTTRDLSIMRETIKKEERQRSKGPKETLSYSHHPKFEGPPIPLTTSNAEFGRGCDIAVKDGVVKKTTSSVKKEFYSDTPMPLTLLQLNAKKWVKQNMGGRTLHTCLPLRVCLSPLLPPRTFVQRACTSVFFYSHMCVLCCASVDTRIHSYVRRRDILR
uniref:Uncharacterized protein n=1 Tax=Palpitomonas bilix TaxID=652834 RepID=A0A7S3GHK5_9EUKA|mmetsp:Transcript_49895/g.128392  ORF Transcript_49895/g.128392 Transcript_49895/m.128392 type:complete len:169 (+) Transcript_49895:283-789(+)